MPERDRSPLSPLPAVAVDEGAEGAPPVQPVVTASAEMTSKYLLTMGFFSLADVREYADLILASVPAPRKRKCRWATNAQLCAGNRAFAALKIDQLQKGRAVDLSKHRCSTDHEGRGADEAEELAKRKRFDEFLVDVL